MDASSSRRLAIAAAGSLACAACLVSTAPRAAAAEHCSSDTFTIDHAPLTLALCPAPMSAQPGQTAHVSIAETVTAGASSFSRSTELEFFDGGTTSRSIDDIPLEQVGIAKTLHVTIVYKAGAVRIEHALLVPGAIPLK